MNQSHSIYSDNSNMSSSRSSPKSKTAIIEHDPQALEDHFQKSLSLSGQHKLNSTWKSKNLPDSFFNHKRKSLESGNKIKLLNELHNDLSAAEINRQTRVRRRKNNHTRNVSEPVQMENFHDPYTEMPNSAGKSDSWYGQEEPCSGPVRREPKHVRASSLTVNNPIARRSRQNNFAVSASNSEKSTISPNNSFENLTKVTQQRNSSGFLHQSNNRHKKTHSTPANFVDPVYINHYEYNKLLLDYPLPLGWEKSYDMAQKKWFYIDHNMKKTFWEHPCEKQFKEIYFRNLQTSQTPNTPFSIHHYQTSGDSGAFEGARLSSREDDGPNIEHFGQSEREFYQQNQLNSNFQNCSLRHDVVVKSEPVFQPTISERRFSSSSIRNTIVAAKTENEQRTSPARPSELSFNNGNREHFMNDGMSTLTPGLTGLTPGPNSELPSDILEFLLSNGD